MLLNRISESLGSKRPKSFEECVVWARLQFQQRFHNEIAQLLHNFPVDSLTSSGNPFWAGAKRPPCPLAFDASDDLHLAFVKGAAVLRAVNYGIQPPAVRDRSSDFWCTINCSMVVPEFKPVDGVKIATTEAE
ncbi:unnamed protein product, partial [Laminaria digitata]